MPKKKTLKGDSSKTNSKNANVFTFDDARAAFVRMMPAAQHAIAHAALTRERNARRLETSFTDDDKRRTFIELVADTLAGHPLEVAPAQVVADYEARRFRQYDPPASDAM